MAEQDYTYPVPDRYREGTEFNAETHVDLQLADKRLLSPEAARAFAEAAAAAERSEAEYANEGVNELVEWLRIVTLETKNLQVMRKAELGTAAPKTKDNFRIAA